MEIIRTGILKTPSLEQGSQYMDSAITLVLMLLDKRMKHLDQNTGTVGVGHTEGTSDIAVLENKWEEKLIEFVSSIDGMDVFSGGRWFRSYMECVEFAEKYTP